MRLPWARKFSRDRIMVSWDNQVLAYVRARGNLDDGLEILESGVEAQGVDTLDALLGRLNADHLRGCSVRFMLCPDQYSLLQVPAPTVPAEEMKSAARYQIRELVNIHIDDLAMDLIPVGDGQQKINPQVFVVATTNTIVRSLLDLAKAMEWSGNVIDVHETCQRNLQAALAQRDGTQTQAEASLVISADNKALVTISRDGELYYTRRIDLPEGFMTAEWVKEEPVLANVPESYTPVVEYVPSYATATPSYDAVAAAPSTSDRNHRLVVELQRSLDLWDRAWSQYPLGRVWVYANERTAELAGWLSTEMGQTVTGMELESVFQGLQNMPVEHRNACVPLLGLLLRPESKTA
jgi:MSHA biogenesis protein MshI